MKTKPLHREAQLSAMIWAEKFAKLGSPVMDFWDALDHSSKNLIRKAVIRLDTLKKEDDD